MTPSTLRGLQRLREYPSVSILVPVQRGPRLVDTDRIRLQRRIDDLARRLLGDVGAETTALVSERLQVRLDAAADEPVRASIVLLASPSTSACFHLDVEVRERTVVDDTFATRDLVDEARRAVAYVAVTVSDQRLQVLDGSGDQLEPSQRADARLERAPDESDTSWLRRTTATLRAVGSGADPLVLFGTERRIADAVRATGLEPAGVIPGNHDRTPWTELAESARGPLAEWTGVRNAAALERLEVARSRRLYAGGLDETWSLASESRVDLLVVERSYAVPVRLDTGHLVPVPPEDIEAPDVVDDAVDDLIEMVALSRGEVVIVPDGLLEAHGRVAAALRY